MSNNFFRGDFESETDTEEFEKIGQGTGDSSKLNSLDSATTAAAATKQLQPMKKQTEVGDDCSMISAILPIATNSCPTLINVAVHRHLGATSTSPRESVHDERSSGDESISPITTANHNNITTTTHNNVASSDDEPHNRSTNDDEFYMDESLPSSLSEPNAVVQHRAIVSLLQVPFAPSSSRMPPHFTSAPFSGALLKAIIIIIDARNHSLVEFYTGRYACNVLLKYKFIEVKRKLLAELLLLKMFPASLACDEPPAVKLKEKILYT